MEEGRKRLEDTRESVTHKAEIYAEPEMCPYCKKKIRGGRTKFFFTIGLYDDGRPGEIFMHMDEGGSTLDGFADAWAIAVSLCLQNGVSVEKIYEKFAFQEFEPKGLTECGMRKSERGREEEEEIKFAKSVVDYVVRWMRLRYASR